MVGISSLPYEYELNPYKYSINTSILPVYKEDVVDGVTFTLEQLIQNTPISKTEFLREWHEIGGCEVEGVCYILPSGTVTKLLDKLLTVMIAEKTDYTKDSINRGKLIDKLKSHEYPEDAINTVVNKFWVGEKDVKVDNQRVAKWYGIQTLKVSRPMEAKQFYIEWKSQFPNFYHIPLNLDDLRGHFYKKSNLIGYLNEASLSKDISTRIKELFKLSSEWDINDIYPYISCLTTRKVESVLLKYSKIKKIGSRKVVCPR